MTDRSSLESGGRKVDEKTQNAQSSLALSGKGKNLKEPTPSRDLTTREKIILLEGSKLHGHIFPPWASSPSQSEFLLKDGEARYKDDVHLSLSAVQLEIFGGWQTPEDILRSGSGSAPSPTVTLTKHDLVQDVTTDCSVVASLCAVTARTERGHVDVFSSIIYPYDSHQEIPAISKSGKYLFRLHFNGCHRKVIVDDRLPASKTSRALHVIDRTNPGVLWPALVEKAYLKVRGGYDFPGSNSGTDLWVLTGWIPEQLFLQSDDIDRKALWRRIFNAFYYGDVLITMGTGKLTRNEEQGLGLVGEHDYAIIDMKEVGDQQLVLVKNPWSNGTVWKGQMRYNNLLTENMEGLRRLQINEKLKSQAREPLSPGTFWMGLSDIFQSFDSIYLNWNPGLFSHRENIHFTWDVSGSSDSEYSFVSNPQFKVHSTTAGIAWLLLSRHFASKQFTHVGDKESESLLSKCDQDQGFVSLYAFSNNGERVYLTEGAVASGPYVDSPNTLLKIELPADKPFTVVVSEQALPRSRIAFTLSALSLTPLELCEARERYSHTSLQQGVWTATTSGGNAGSSKYHVNPQYSIKLLETSNLSFLLETPSRDLSVHVKLVWANGMRVQSLSTRDIVGDSGAYRRGCANAEIQSVQAGIYTIVCSTFEQGQTGKFNLRIGSMTACEIQRLPIVAAGRFVFELQTAIFAPAYDRLIAPLTVGHITRMFLHAQSRGDTSAPSTIVTSPLRIVVELGKGPTKQALAVSGDNEFADTSHSGVRTADVDIQQGMCPGRGLWIVLERLGCSGLLYNETVEVTVFSDGPISIGPWVIEEA